jgi:hypothetical protein
MILWTNDPLIKRYAPGSRLGSAPWQVLLWANSRVDLPGQERQTGWRWHCAPLAEWDGVNPRTR